MQLIHHRRLFFHVGCYLHQKNVEDECVFIVVYFIYEMLPLRMTTISDDNEHNNIHHHQIFFICYLHIMTMFLLIFSLAFTTQLVVVFFLSFATIDGNLLIFC
jgi:hypothetical protein